MPKANRIDVPRHPRNRQTSPKALGASLSRHGAGLLLAAAGGSLLWTAPAQAQETQPGASASSMQQIIEAARRKKAQELEAAARRMLGADASPAAVPAPPPVQLPAPGAQATPEEVPRVWSLSGVDQRLEAELYYQGRIHRIHLNPHHPAQVGPWVVRGITPSGVTVALAAGHRSAHRWPSPLILPPPARGSSLASFPFHAGAAAPAPLPGLGSAALPPSAFRANQLPTHTSVAAATPREP